MEYYCVVLQASAQAETGYTLFAGAGAFVDMRVWACVDGLPTVLLYQYKREKGSRAIGKSRLAQDYEAVKGAVDG